MSINPGPFHYTEDNKGAQTRESFQERSLVFVILLVPHIYKRSEAIFKTHFPFENHTDTASIWQNPQVRIHT